MKTFRQLYEDGSDWDGRWTPNQQQLNWFKALIFSLSEGAVWAAPMTQQVYKISHHRKTFTLIHGDSNDPLHWHDKNKIVLGLLGYSVIDGRQPEPPENPDQVSFADCLTAQRIASELFEDMGAPFSKAKVTLQYRPFMLGEDWKWFWVLLPEDQSKSLGSGQADNRAEAAVAARLAARKLGVEISDIDVMMPQAQRDQAGTD